MLLRCVEELIQSCRGEVESFGDESLEGLRELVDLFEIGFNNMTEAGDCLAIGPL